MNDDAATPQPKEQKITVPRENWVAHSLVVKMRDLPPNRFSGRHVRQNSVKRRNIKKRDRRLRKHGYSVVMFAS